MTGPLALPVKHYLIAEIHVHDRDWVPGYLAGVTRLVHRHGGEFLARSPTVERLEGEGPPPDVVAVIAFPSREAALGFYTSDEYQPYRAARHEGSSGAMILVAGEDVALRRS